ncbi:MAG: hypothetical protein JO040_06200 [Gemmatimonadetes bacterium]|nr:hypothetical protein [Gemmatimonadota bacterium]
MAFTYCRGCGGRVEIGLASCTHCGIPRPTVFRRPNPATPTIRHRISGGKVVLLWVCGLVAAVGLIVPAMSYSARNMAGPGSAFVEGETGFADPAAEVQAVPSLPAAAPALSGRERFEQVATAIRHGFPHVRVEDYDAGAPRTMRIIVPVDYPSYRARTLAEDARERLGPDARVEVRDVARRNVARAEPPRK